MPLHMRVRMLVFLQLAVMLATAAIVAWLGYGLFNSVRMLQALSELRLQSQGIISRALGLEGSLSEYVSSPSLLSLQHFSQQRHLLDAATDVLLESARDLAPEQRAARALNRYSDVHLARIDALIARAGTRDRALIQSTLASSRTFTEQMVRQVIDFESVLEADRRIQRNEYVAEWRVAEIAFGVLALGGILSPLVVSELTLQRFRQRTSRLSRRAAAAARGEDLHDVDHVRDALGDLDRDLASIAAEVREKDDKMNRAIELKSQFVAIVSHEIRTPLNGIIGLGELLLRTDLNADQRDLARNLQDSSTALLAIINDILDFSKLEAGRVELESVEFRPSELVDSVVDLVGRAVAAKPVTLLTHLAPSVPAALRGDPGRLRQVLLNLVGNAVKFTPSGHVIVSVDASTSGSSCCNLRWEVIDSGIGMTPEAQAHIFQPFAQADASTTRRFGGTGLGLAICKRFVELMGGMFEVSSEVGRGTSIAFTVPLEIAQPPAQKPKLHLLEDLRTLVVSNDEGTKTVLQRYAAGWKMRVGSIGTIDELLPAIKAAKKSHDPFRLAIVDCTIVQGACNLCSTILCDPELRPTKLVMVNGNFGCVGQKRRTNPRPVLQSEVFNSIVSALDPDASSLETLPKIVAPAKDRDSAAIRGLRILVAEDSPVNQKVATRQLATLGAQCVTAPNGSEAVLRSQDEHYDVILMDCSMPVMDGFTATREIRERERLLGKHIPIVAMTANASAADRENCLAAGMDDYVSKPVTIDALRDVLMRITAAGRVLAEKA